MSNNEIITLQQMVDFWYEKWVVLKGREGMKNYVHMLGLFHVTYYLRKKRNVYRCSNQYWERLNKCIKRFYLTTSRGRNGYYASKIITNIIKCTHNVPLGRWLQVVVVWNTGYGYEYFTSKDKN